jgi:hypothetical protein
MKFHFTEEQALALQVAIDHYNETYPFDLPARFVHAQAALRTQRLGLNRCSECGGPAFVEPSGVSHHGEPGAIDYDVDADHVALPEDNK